MIFWGNLRVKNYDFVILGAGSAGCVLASKLSKNPNFNVCLIEAGSKDSDPRIHIPIGFAFLGDGSKYSWNYETVPQKEFEKDLQRLYRNHHLRLNNHIF